MLRFVSAGFHFRSLLSVQRFFPNKILLTSSQGLSLTFSVDPLIELRNNITDLWKFEVFIKGLRVYKKSVINSFELSYLN